MAIFQFTGKVTRISCEKNSQTNQITNHICFLGDLQRIEDQKAIWYIAEKAGNKGLLRVEKDSFFTAPDPIYNFILANKNEKLVITFGCFAGEDTKNENEMDGSEYKPYQIIKAELRYD